MAISGRYNRNVLFIKGDEPYLIDLNSLYTQVYDPQKYNNEIDDFGGSVQELIFIMVFQTLSVNLRTNPFNPSTVIPFKVASNSRVTIEVYNMLGRKVAVLTDRTYNPGSYQVTFSADRMASGIYFIRTEMNNKLFNQKVTLIK